MSQPPLNILFVICDDLGYGDLSCYGNPHLRTPRLDACAAQGVCLTRHDSGPVCTPARASVMTGRYPYRTRAIDTYLGRSMIDPSERALARCLSDAGYTTGLFGKWHLGDLGAHQHPAGGMLMDAYDAWFDDVSSERGAANYDPPRIVLGSPDEPTTHLTWQDWRLYPPRDDAWWAEDQPGFWLVRVAGPGPYRIHADLPEIAEPTVLRLRCGGIEAQYPILPGERTASLGPVDLPPGDQRLEVFIGPASPELGPQVVSVESSATGSRREGVAG